MNTTPRSNRLHIGLFGRRNSGKSSLVNALTGQNTALVSDIAGTTTDPVYKAMEIHGLGPCVFIDTAGVDDEGGLGELRVEKTREALEKTDIALVLFSEGDLSYEKEWVSLIRSRKTPIVGIINKADILKDANAFALEVEKACKITPLVVSAKDGTGISKIRDAVIRALPEDYENPDLIGPLANENDLVLLVMPQDIQAPKGRLILPQVQTIRSLLDRKCLVMSCTTDKLDETFKALAFPPKLIITDSQVFKTVHEKKPRESRLTSFSILFANQKGDLEYYIKSAAAIDRLTENSRVLIAEACTHAPLTEDIGRVKIPALLRKKVGQGLTVDIVSGIDFPEDLSTYDLIIHCGACMFNRKYVLSRIRRAKEQGIPMSNYGVVIAYMNNIQFGQFGTEDF